MTRLDIASTARSDLREIRRYSKAAFGSRITLAYLAGLRGRMEMLLDHPSIGRTEADLGEGIRSLGYRSHRIFYRHAGGTLTIVRVLHHSQEIQAAFPPP